MKKYIVLLFCFLICGCSNNNKNTTDTITMTSEKTTVTTTTTTTTTTSVDNSKMKKIIKENGWDLSYKDGIASLSVEKDNYRFDYWKQDGIEYFVVYNLFGSIVKYYNHSFVYVISKSEKKMISVSDIQKPDNYCTLKKNSKSKDEDIECVNDKIGDSRISQEKSDASYYLHVFNSFLNKYNLEIKDLVCFLREYYDSL